MKKATLTLIGIIFMLTTFSQSFIGISKKELLNNVKETVIKMEKSSKESDGTYSITCKFQNCTNIYTFSSDDICFFYIIVEKFYEDNYINNVKYYDDRYLRALDSPCSTGKKSDVWKEPKGGTFVYRWILCNYNVGVQYTLFLTKENYENNKYQYMKNLLGSN